MNILQISFDKSFWDRNAPESTLQRQQKYLKELKKIYNNAKIFIVVINTSKEKFQLLDYGDLKIIPLNTNKFFFFFSFFRVLFKIIKKENINIIAPQSIFEDGWVSLLLAKIFKIQIVGQIHMDFLSEGFYNELGFLNKFRIFLAKKTLKYYDRIRVVSTPIKDNLIIYQLVDENKIFVNPVYVPVKELNYEKKYNKIKKILFVGRFVYAKNIFLWLEVTKEIKKNFKNVEFILAGDGELLEKTKNYAKKLNIYDSCKFLGNVKYENVAKLFYESDLFLLTSRYEGFGRVMVESYLNKTPVVSTKVSGANDIIINNETGFICELNDKKCLVDKCLKLLKNEKLAKSFGEKGYKYVKEKFNKDKLIKEWIEVLIGRNL
jgi:glycosyltransferase involved in cell wall biosynthesis